MMLKLMLRSSNIFFVIIFRSFFFVRLLGDKVLLKKGKHKRFAQNDVLEHGFFFFGT